MAKRYDIIVGREGNGKTYWTKIGAAFERENGGFSLTFDALPIADANGCRALMVEPKQRDGRQEYSNKSMGGENFQAPPAMDDEIPF